MNKRAEAGFTVPEVLVTLVIAGLLISLIIGFMINSLSRYGIAGARAELLNEAQVALDITSNDIRISANADANNRYNDSNAPSAPSNLLSWQSNSTTLVLATAAQDSSRNILFSDASKYISQKNNIIYFVKNKTLYRRVLAAPVTGNVAKTTCPSASATTSCPADKALINNVDTFTIKYFDKQGAEVTPTSARSVELYIKLNVVRFPNSVIAEYKTRMTFRNA